MPTAPGEAAWRFSVAGAVSEQMALVRLSGGPVLIIAWISESIQGIENGHVGGFTLGGATEIWHADLPAAAAGGACPAGDTLLVAIGATSGVGPGAGKLLAVEAGTGNIKWTTPLGGSGRSTPVRHEPRVYVTACDGALHRFDERNGECLGNPIAVCEKPRVMLAPPAIWVEQDRVEAIVVGTTDAAFGREPGFVAAFNDRGERLWEQQVDGSVRGAPVVSEGVVYAAAYGGQTGTLYALRARNGNPVWPKPFTAPGRFCASPLIRDGRVYVTTLDHHVYCLDARTGDLLWQSPDLEKGLAGAPVMIEDLVIAGANDGRVHALDAGTGALVWTYELGGHVLTTPLVADHHVIVASHAGQIASLPWHLGNYSWAAERMEKRGRRAEAGDYHALAAHFSAQPYQHEGYLRACTNWDQAGQPEKSAYLRASLPWIDPAERGSAFRLAADNSLRAPERAAVLLFKAAAYFDEAGQQQEVQACERRGRDLAPVPYLTVLALNPHEFEPDEEGKLSIEIKNRGSSTARLFLRLGGIITNRIRIQGQQTLRAGEKCEYEVFFVPTHAGNLIVDLLYYDDADRDHHLTCPIPLAVRPSPQVVIGGDAGMVRVQTKGGSMPRIKVSGDIGYLKVTEDS